MNQVIRGDLAARNVLLILKMEFVKWLILICHVNSTTIQITRNEARYTLKRGDAIYRF